MTTYEEVGAQADAEIAGLTAEIAGLTAELAAWEELTNAACVENAQLKDELAAVKVKSGEWEELTNALCVENAQLKDEINRLKNGGAPADPWEKAFSTTFDTNDGWTLRDERQDNDHSRNVPRNAVFGQGLTIYGKRETVGTGTAQRDYTTADVLGYHKAVKNHFRARVVGKAAHIRGIWPCILWFRPANGNDGEIDLMEHFGADDGKVHATIHTEYGATHRQFTKGIAWPGDPEAYHEYIVEKTPGRILITIDGITIMDAKRGETGVLSASDWDRIFEVSGRTWYPRVTMQIGYGTIGPAKVGLPAADWTQSTMHIKSLDLWNLK